MSQSTPTQVELANALRVLSMDAVQAANSGHPGAPMGMADIAEVLWRDYLNHNPQNPQWFNRDRFVLSNGHASALLYSLLHLTGYALSMEQIKRFRQFGSQTPGHPECGVTPGVETTTGPLGQGFANAVGMALAEQNLAREFNRAEYKIIDHHTYAFVGDGCLMEGISHEAASLAGTLQLGKLIVFYDANGISIDGDVQGWFTDNTALRFDAYHWHVLNEIDGHDSVAISEAIQAAQQDPRPSLLICHTEIGKGSPLVGSAKTHGAPLGEDNQQITRKNLNWEHPPFVIPEKIYQAWDQREAGAEREQLWQQTIAHYTQHYPQQGAELQRRIEGALPDDFDKQSKQFISTVQQQAANIATRKASLECLETYTKWLPELLGGSADLASSNLVKWSESKVINANQGGNYIHYGVREFAMLAIGNGIACHGGLLPFVATFLVFLDYARNALRLAALMKLRMILVCTHDSIGLGEDGPTHQPIEHLAHLRATPGVSTWRPCDATETATAWQLALQRDNAPTVLVLSRQSLPAQERNEDQLKNIAKGGYTLWQTQKPPELVIIATGSEVQLAVTTAHHLAEHDKGVRVVSMPSIDCFEQQTEAYRNQVLPPDIPRLIIEAAHSQSWQGYLNVGGRVIGINDFGASAPGGELMEHFGFSTEQILTEAQEILGIAPVNAFANGAHATLSN